ncbi:hypothetical protein KHP62_02350 [Rhodobacteraceae bacterium NNCM2]|nr:hypothetical protein [Coraliihabitans acroporae]
MTRPRLIGALLGALIPMMAQGDESDGRSVIAQFQKDLELGAHERLRAVREATPDGPNAFTTDGCSGGLSQIWSVVAEYSETFSKTHQSLPPWEECCIAHDQLYHAAGDDPAPVQSYAARLAADEALEQCVLAVGETRKTDLMAEYGLTEAEVSAAYRNIASAMFVAVRLGGGPCTGLPWRWGYGYPGCL